MSINKRKTKDPKKIVIQVKQEPRLKADIPVAANEYTSTAKHKANLNADISVSEDTAKVQRNTPPVSVKSDIPVAADELVSTPQIETKPVSADIPVASDEYTGTSHKDAELTSDIPVAADSSKVQKITPSINVTSDISVASDEYTTTQKKKAELRSDISVSDDTANVQAIDKPINITSAVSIADDTHKVQNIKPSAKIGSDIPSASDEYTAVAEYKAELSSDIKLADDTAKIQSITKSHLISTDIPDANNEIVPTVQKPVPAVSSEIPDVPDTPKMSHNIPQNRVGTDIPGAKDEIVSIVKRQAQLSSDIYVAQGEGKKPRFKDGFNGQWRPNSDPLKIEKGDFSTLQNLRYTDDGLEGVGGSSRINTTGLGAPIKNGIHFKTNYTEDSFVIVQRDDGTQPELVVNKTDIPDAGAFAFTEIVEIVLGVNDSIYLKSTVDSGTYPLGSGFVGIIVDEGIYTCVDFATELQAKLRGTTTNAIALKKGGSATETIVLSVSYSTTTKLFTITTDDPQYKLQYSFTSSSLDTEIGLTGDDLTWGQTIVSDTAIVSQTSLIIEDSDASLARMSLLPNGHVGICDQINNYIWAGDEMPCGAFLTGTFNTKSVTAGNDVLVFTSDQGGPQSIDVADDSDYTCDQVADALETAMNGDGTLTGGAITFSVISQMGRTYIDAGAGHTIAFTYAGSDGADTHGFTADISAAQTITSQGFQRAAPYIDEGKIKNKTEQINNNLTDSANLVSITSTTADAFFLIGSLRPLKGFTVDISSANGSTSTLSVKYFDGSKFVSVSSLSDGTSASSKSLAQDGDVTFTDTDGSAFPSFHGGFYLYFYLCEITAGSATIAGITLDAAIQDVNDLWDGKWRIPLKTSFADFKGAAQYDYKDYTLEMAQESYQNVGDKTYQGNRYVIDYGTLSDNEDDVIEVIFKEKINAIKIDLFERETTGSIYEIFVQCWDGDSWVDTTLSYSTDIDKLVSLTKHYVKSGYIFYDIPSGTIESKINKDNVIGYAYRIGHKYSGTVTELEIDTISGLPRASTLINRYLFPFHYQNKAMWCNSLSDKEYNRVDHSKTNAPDVYNGEDASGHENERSLYFGSYEALTCAIELFSLRGDTLDTYSLFFKNAETYMLTGNSVEDYRIHDISKTIGCPAFRTLTAAEVSFGVENSPKLNIALWLSDKGPVMWYNNSIMPIPGIENYFDPSHDDYIDKSNIDKAAAWFDYTYKAWNLLLPSGSSQSTDNTWLIYDLMRRKWYEKTGEDYFPQGGFQVEDTDGNKYIYAYDESGYLQRVENGLTWSDGSTGITNTAQSADLTLSDGIWDEIELFYHKILFRDNDEGSISVAVYKDGNTTAESSTNLPSSATMAETDNYRYRNLITILSAIIGFTFKFLTTITGCTVTKPKLLAWGLQYDIYREDTSDKSDLN